jgi:uncharacterized protein YccT (UPF0319 family)
MAFRLITGKIDHMKIRRIVHFMILQYLLVASLCVQADAQQATLFIPEELNILSVDNVKHTGKLFSSDDTTLKLKPGQHRILVEYEVIWDVSSDDHERILSKPFLIIFSAEASRQYAIKLPSFNNVDEVQKYANKPVFSLIDRSTNRPVAIKVVYHAAERGFFGQFNNPVVPARPVQNPAPAAAVPAKKPVNSQRTGITTTGSNMPLKMLEYWWSQANEQQRKHFIESIKK